MTEVKEVCERERVCVFTNVPFEIIATTIIIKLVFFNLFRFDCMSDISEPVVSDHVSARAELAIYRFASLKAANNLLFCM